MTKRRRFLALPLLLGLHAGCFLDAGAAFTDGRTYDRCNAALPVCTSTAACVLDDTNYTDGAFGQGATRRIIVRTAGPARIEVSVFFSTQVSPGLETEVAWFEVGCRDRYAAGSEGRDVFAEAGAARVWTRSQTVTSAGDHLVELYSDAQADYLLAVRVLPEG